MRKTTLVLLLAAVLAPALFLTTCTMVPGSGDYFAYVLEGEWLTLDYISHDHIYEYKGMLEIDSYTIEFSEGFEQTFYSYVNTSLENFTPGTTLEGYSVRTSRGGYSPEHEGLLYIEDKGKVQEGIAYVYYETAGGDSFLAVEPNTDNELIFKKVEEDPDDA